VRYFFAFLASQPLTENLDLTLFSLPYEPPAVSAFRISPNELDALIRTLLNTPQSSLLTRLFQAVTASLAFHAMLRRGEVLRLRLKDIHPLPYLNDQCFHLTITTTEEGRPKGGKQRDVSVCLPPDQSELLRQLLELKSGEPDISPVIGLHSETIAQRTERYLQPVSRVLKQLFGAQTRFHHLRHSGAHVFDVQLLRLAYDNLLSPSLYYIDDNHFVYEMSTVNARLTYWLEGRAFLTVNPAILFDELCRQLAHEYYATTRWSYLHDIAWLPEIMEKGEMAYSHAELRYILNLSPGSNDISRRIKALNPNVYSLSVEERKQDPVFINQQLLINALSHTHGEEEKNTHELSLHDEWVETAIYPGLYSMCERRSLFGIKPHLSFESLSTLARLSSGIKWRKGLLNALSRVF